MGYRNGYTSLRMGYTWARPVKTRPQVCGWHLKHFEVKFAQEYFIQFETAVFITECEYGSAKCKLVE